MKRNKQLFKLLKGNVLVFFVVVLMTIIHRLTYSYVPLFSQILIDKLDNYINDNNLNYVNLPKFMLNIINNESDIFKVVIIIILMLLIWQLLRYVLLFFEARTKGVLSQNISKENRG